MNQFRAPPLLYYPDFYPDPTWLRAILLLADEVVRIVPEEVEPEDSDLLKEIAGELGALSNISPQDAHITPFGPAGEWLEQALTLLGANMCARGPRGSVNIEVGPGGVLRFPERVFIYNQKLSDRVRHLLVKNGLVDRSAQELAQEVGGLSGITAVHRDAAALVLSFIADSIARDRGLTPITSESLPFAMNGLAGLNVPVRAPAGSSEGMLASVFASVLVPKEVGTIRFSDYRILRDRSADLRAAFAEFVGECNALCRLDRIENTTRLQAKVERCGKQLATEFRKFHRGTNKAMRVLRDWWPLGIGGMLTLMKDVVPPQWAIPATLAAQGVKFVAQGTSPSPHRTKEKVFNLIGQLGNDIRSLPEVSQLTRQAQASA